MSTFLQRMAQRAAGTEVRWQPRPLARFEPQRPPFAQRWSGTEMADDGPSGRVRSAGEDAAGEEWSQAAQAPRSVTSAQPPPAVAAPEPAVGEQVPAPAGPRSAKGGGAGPTSRKLDLTAGSHERPSPPQRVAVAAGEPPEPLVSATGRPSLDDSAGEPTGAQREIGSAPAPGPSSPPQTPWAPEAGDPDPASRAPRQARGRSEAVVPGAASLMQEHVVPALRERGLLGPAERVELHGEGAPRTAVRPGRTAVQHTAVQGANASGGRGEAGADPPTRDHTDVVHLHIDRVEVVRAAPVPDPAPKSAPAPTGPSRLDAYLEHRRTDRR